jgi:hypothetical protein
MLPSETDVGNLCLDLYETTDNTSYHNQMSVIKKFHTARAGTITSLAGISSQSTTVHYN